MDDSKIDLIQGSKKPPGSPQSGQASHRDTPQELPLKTKRDESTEFMSILAQIRRKEVRKEIEAKHDLRNL